jgi:cobyrinic acid a,c-diamide synthase
MNYPRLVIAGTHSGVGKTTVTLALMAALKARGRRVQPFKVGPDFIDPGHHTAVCGRPSRNLDGWMLGATISRELFLKGAAGAELSIIEGVMGLFDGSSPINETGSTAEVAKLLESPVVLVIDGSAMARSAAAMALGYAKFDPALLVAGVIFNRVSGEGHYRLLKAAVESETDLAVLGYLKSDAQLTIPDRHLGLVTALEFGSASIHRHLAEAARYLDLDKVESLAQGACALRYDPPPAAGLVAKSVRIGVAYDPAFCFYYPENLELLEAEGADIVRFSPIHDHALPDVDLLYLGGGYPELYAEGLSQNRHMRSAIQTYGTNGGAIYAECGGMMYLMESVRDFEGRSHEMVGLFAGEAVMSRSAMMFGYREVEIDRPCLLGQPGTRVRGHEFHYSSLSTLSPPEYGCTISDAQNKHRGRDGLIKGNAIAMYTHLHFSSNPGLAGSILHTARKNKNRISSLR